MTEQTMIRFAMILQNQAPSTLDKYVSKLALAVLLDYPEGITLFELRNTLNTQFKLDFTEEEIDAAIKKKGQKDVIFIDGVYKLTPATQRKLWLQSSFTEELDGIIIKFLQEYPFEESVEYISALLLRFFYYCFNSNVDNLLLLFENRINASTVEFEASGKDITIINDFISWDNPKKNALVYSIIATCYDYCMLTIKKDKILSSALFNGKRFYLDANIIFRMSGINNEERKTVTQSFVKHCRQVGIELYCTSHTLDEVYRVINSEVEYIKSISGTSMPVSCETLESLNSGIEINDFYRLYYNWCQSVPNQCGDYMSFQKYLLNLVQETLSQLQIKDSSLFKFTAQAEEYSQQVISLKHFKNEKRHWRHTSTLSAETDVTNIMDTLTWRRGTGTNIWQTNDFIVSADQLLIYWSNENYSGVPLVVLPSVWLSIILRFSGRTDDDYKSFCLFLTQRQHINVEESINPIELLKTISQRTNKTEIKEQIIAEISQNKSQYSFKTTDDYVNNTERAFDKVLETVYGNTELQISQVREEMQQEISKIQQSNSEKIAEEAERRAMAEREKTVIALSRKKAANSVCFYRKANDFAWIMYILTGFAIIALLSVWIWEIHPFYWKILSLVPYKIKGTQDTFFGIWGLFVVAIGVLSGGIKGFIAYMGSERREKRLYKKYYRKNLDALE